MGVGEGLSPRTPTYSNGVLALTADMVKNASLGGLVVLVLFGLLAVKIMQSVTQKLISLAITAALLFGVWTQRANVSDCADQVKTQAQAQTQAGQVPSVDATCHFFGKDVNVKLP